MTIKTRLSRIFERILTFIRQSYDDTISIVAIETVPSARDLAGFVIRGSESSDPAPQRSAITRRSASPYAPTETEMNRAALQVRDLGRAARAGGRASVESQVDIRFNAGVNEFIQMNTDKDMQDIFSYSERYVRNMRPSKLLEMLSEASPEMSRALFDFLLMCCPGWDLKAVNENDDVDQRADAYLDECIAKLRDNYVAPETVYVKMFMSAFLRGAICSEIVLDKRGREFVDISPIDPDSLEHHRTKDPTRGMIWKIYQRQGKGVPVDLSIPQVAYVPIHPFFGTNRGRPLARPAIFVCFFLISTLQDLRRVIRQQGYPRVDIAVNIEKLRTMLPQAKQKDMTAIKTLAEGIVKEVKAIYSSLKPDDTFVHTEVVEVNQPVGTLNASSLGVVGEILECLERMATRALKTMPLLMATTDNVSEANANRQWEIHAAGIKSMQHNAESILESHFNVALRAKGFQARAIFRFSELRAAELLRDAQVELLNTTIARQQFDNGSINADEMAKKSANKDKADVPQPRVSNKPTPNLPSDDNPEPGGNRSLSQIVIEQMLRMTAQDIADASELFKTYAPDAAKELLDAQVQS